MTKQEIDFFQRQDRFTQMKLLLAERLKAGYCLADFEKEYNVSELDKQDFLTIKFDLCENRCP